MKKKKIKMKNRLINKDKTQSWQKGIEGKEQVK